MNAMELPQYAPAPASDDLNSHPELSGWRSPRMLVMRSSMYQDSTWMQYVGYGFVFRRYGWLFGHGLNRPGDLDLWTFDL